MFRAWAVRFSHYALVLVACALLALPNLGQPSLWDIDEGLNAEAAREMLESGNWIVPSFNFKPRTAKPAMLYWFQSASYRQFGVNEFAARFPSALAMTASALLLYELGRRMFGPLAGLLAGTMFAGSIQVCVLAHAATPDALLLFGVVLTMTLFWLTYSAGSRAWIWLPAVGMAWAVLAKGPVGLVLPCGVIGVFLFTRGGLRELLNRRLAIGVLLFLALALPWYVLVGSETRGAFLRGFWYNENVNRFLSPMEQHEGNVLFYPCVILIGFAPWCCLLLPMLWESGTLALHRGEGEKLEKQACRFLLVWAGLYLAFFTAAATKLPNYVLPIYPPLTLLAARQLARWAEGGWRLPHAWMGVTLGAYALAGIITGAGLLIAGGQLLVPLMHGREIVGIGQWSWIGLIPIVAAGVAGWYYARQQRRALVGTLVGSGVAYTAFLAAFPAAHLEAQKAPKALVALSGACQPTREIRIGCHDYYQPSLVYYCQREVRDLSKPADAIDFLNSPIPVYLFATEAAWLKLQPQLPANVRVAATRRDIYRNTNVVVITNSDGQLAGR